MWDPSKFHHGDAASSRAYDRSNPARYAAKAGRASALPKHFKTTDKTPDLAATSKKFLAESDRKMQYPKPVRSKTERTARG